jgi:microsomal dipeptidase-like Zn-dependent dipeptidase
MNCNETLFGIVVTSFALLANTPVLAQQTPVWGFADLHTHPASHLGFGSDSNGNNGLFWGKPADDGSDSLHPLSSFNPAADLPSCANAFGIETHNTSFSDALDVVKLYTENTIVSQLDNTVKLPFNHQSSGSPGFQSWPISVSVDHQQMDVTSLYRAYQGGLRLLFASVTTDEILSDLWHQGFNLFGNSMPTHDPSFDWIAAMRQLTYVQNLAAVNQSWMTIVTSPAAARAAINPPNNKLAIVLSLEMDSLQLWQVLDLVQRFNVRHVIPVHLVDNVFGGTAVYNDQFNSENYFFDGSFYKVTTDPNVSQGVGVPSILTTTTSGLISGFLGNFNLGALDPCNYWPVSWACNSASMFGYMPISIDAGTFKSLNYPALNADGMTSTPGVINATRLSANNFYSLMTAQCNKSPCGLLLDIAHMGELSANDALTLAEQYQYPVMDSHTGIRCDGKQAPHPVPNVDCFAPGVTFPSAPSGGTPVGVVNERSIPVSQVQRISRLGGVIGLGLVSSAEGGGVAGDPDPVSTWLNSYAGARYLMGGKGVALGSDTNGLSPLIQGDTFQGVVQMTTFPIGVATQLGAPAGTQPLAQFKLGQRSYQFGVDGIATYALMPDFIQAAYNATLTPPSAKGTLRTNGTLQDLQALFHTAEDVIEMWEKATLAAANLPSARSSQQATSCYVIADVPLGQTVPVIGKPANIYTMVLDQVGLPLSYPSLVTYSGNILNLQNAQSTYYQYWKPAIPGKYTVKASIGAGAGTISCSATYAIYPELDSIASALTPATMGSNVTVLANADGSTLLTLAGSGLSTVVGVSFDGSVVSVKSTSDSSLQVRAPAYVRAPTGPVIRTVGVQVTTSSGISSRTLPLQYFVPYVPIAIATSYGSCNSNQPATYSVDAWVMDTNAQLIPNAPLALELGGVTTFATTPAASAGVFQPAEASFYGSFANLNPKNSYTGTIRTAWPVATSPVAGNTVRGPVPVPVAKAPASSTFTLPAVPPVNQASCKGIQVTSSSISTGPLIVRPGGTCVACSLSDLRSVNQQTSYMVEDVFTFGAMIPVKGLFLPAVQVTRDTFLYGLSKVANPQVVQRLAIHDAGTPLAHALLTRGEAAATVVYLMGGGAPAASNVGAATQALITSGFLDPINGSASPEVPLTRGEMAILLWHVANSEFKGRGTMSRANLYSVVLQTKTVAVPGIQQLPPASVVRPQNQLKGGIALPPSVPSSPH